MWHRRQCELGWLPAAGRHKEACPPSKHCLALTHLSPRCSATGTMPSAPGCTSSCLATGRAAPTALHAECLVLAALGAGRCPTRVQWQVPPTSPTGPFSQRFEAQLGLHTMVDAPLSRLDMTVDFDFNTLAGQSLHSCPGFSHCFSLACPGCGAFWQVAQLIRTSWCKPQWRLGSKENSPSCAWPLSLNA